MTTLDEIIKLQAEVRPEPCGDEGCPLFEAEVPCAGRRGSFHVGRSRDNLVHIAWREPDGRPEWIAFPVETAISLVIRVAAVVLWEPEP